MWERLGRSIRDSPALAVVCEEFRTVTSAHTAWSDVFSCLCMVHDPSAARHTMLMADLVFVASTPHIVTVWRRYADGLHSIHETIPLDPRFLQETLGAFSADFLYGKTLTHRVSQAGTTVLARS